MSTPSTTPGTPSAHLQIPGQHPELIHRLKNVPGYTTPVFKGKEEQRAKVQANIAAKVSTRRAVPSRYRTRSRRGRTAPLCE